MLWDKTSMRVPFHSKMYGRILPTRGPAAIAAFVSYKITKKIGTTIYYIFKIGCRARKNRARKNGVPACT